MMNDERSICRGSPVRGKEEILALRAMELKHGRVAMLAVLGWFHVAAGYHIVPGFLVCFFVDVC